MQLSITLSIIIVTVLVSLGGFSNQKIVDDLIFYPPAVTGRKQWYRFFTCGLIHADFGHLLFNMVSFYSFGPFVEKKFTDLFDEAGKWYYLIMYISALLISLLPTYLKNKNNQNYRSLGASGAVSAVVFACLLIAPDSEVGLIFIPFLRIPGFAFAPLYVLFSIMMERRGRGNINHSAHIWGALYGLAFVIIVCSIVNYPIVQECIDKIQNYLSN